MQDFDIAQDKLSVSSGRVDTQAVEERPHEPSRPIDLTLPVRNAEGPDATAPGARAARRACFVVMPFASEPLNIVYEDFVRPTLKKRCRLRVERGDDVFGSNVIMDDVVARISRASIVIVDLTGRNANVCYEAGIAHAMKKQVLLMAQSIDDVPFDLRHRRVLLYEYSPRGCKKLERDLMDHVHAMLQLAEP